MEAFDEVWDQFEAELLHEPHNAAGGYFIANICAFGILATQSNNSWTLLCYCEV